MEHSECKHINNTVLYSIVYKCMECGGFLHTMFYGDLANVAKRLRQGVLDFATVAESGQYDAEDLAALKIAADNPCPHTDAMIEATDCLTCTSQRVIYKCNGCELTADSPDMIKYYRPKVEV